MPSPNAESGRRGNWRYTYGTHAWVPFTDNDWHRGMIRDQPRTSIPPGGLYDAADFLLDQPGLMRKRGGTSYAGPAMTAATYAAGVAYAEFPAGSKVVAVGDNGHIYTVAGSTTDVGGTTVTGGLRDTPKLRIGGAKNLLIFPCGDGTTSPVKYDGTAAPSVVGGGSASGKFCALYKSRLAIGGSATYPNRIYFSPTPDIESTWDTTNSWVDFDHAVTGMAALANSLLVFSLGHTERLTGTTPPPNSDMDRQPVGDIGCSDARSIVIYEGNAIFASPRGVFLTNGVGFQCLTKLGGIDSYWQTLLSSYNPSTWTITAGVFKNFLFVTTVDNNGIVGSSGNANVLMCDLTGPRWWRVTNISPTMFASGVGIQDELYFSDRSTNRVVALSGIFSPTSANKNDANGTAVAPLFETRAFGGSQALKAWGEARLMYDLRDNGNSPTLGILIAQTASPRFSGVSANSTVPSESPLIPTTADSVGVIGQTAIHKFTLAKDDSFMSVRVTQSNASSLTEIYSLEVDQRAYPQPRIQS